MVSRKFYFFTTTFLRFFYFVLPFGKIQIPAPSMFFSISPADAYSVSQKGAGGGKTKLFLVSKRISFLGGWDAALESASRRHVHFLFVVFIFFFLAAFSSLPT